MDFSAEKNEYLCNLFESFMNACADIPRDVFITSKNDINASLFEAVFVAVANDCYKKESLITTMVDSESIRALKNDLDFKEAITHSTSHTNSVKTRLEKACEYLFI